MAKINLFAPKLLQHEGGFVDHKNDKGGPTNKGITLKNWKIYGYDKDNDFDIDVDDLKLIDLVDYTYFLKKYYWDRWQADKIKNQSIAEILVDWTYNSGNYGIKIPQQILNLKPDGIVGFNTLSAVNNADQEDLFNKIYRRRLSFYNGLVTSDPSQKVFLLGWMVRLKSFKFYA